MTDTQSSINLHEKLALIGDLWNPRILAEVNDFLVKLVKVRGEFVWHAHEDEDELFLVLDGSFTVQMRDSAVTLGAGELFVVPRGVEHCPSSPGGASVLLLERKSTAHTGDVRSELTVDEQEWI